MENREMSFEECMKQLELCAEKIKNADIQQTLDENLRSVIGLFNFEDVEKDGEKIATAAAEESGVTMTREMKILLSVNVAEIIIILLVRIADGLSTMTMFTMEKTTTTLIAPSVMNATLGAVFITIHISPTPYFTAEERCSSVWNWSWTKAANTTTKRRKFLTAQTATIST